ncbi:MAG: uncharacterized protein JWN61_2434 [Pseudonocardiales bacterium]|nr:uncharacterized protein [Pseudonocardiales bacterium]
MIAFAVILFPLGLLLFMLLMERVEQPLRTVATERDVEQFLNQASPAEMDSFVRNGPEPAITQFRARRGLSRLLPGERRRRKGSHPS